MRSARGTVARAESERRDGLRAAHFEDVRHAQHRRHAQDLVHRFGRRDADIGNARHLRRNHGHHHRRGQRIASRGHVRRHGIERPHDLPRAQSGAQLARPFARHLPLRVRADVGRRRFDRRRGTPAPAASRPRADRPPQRARWARESIELARVFEKRFIAAAAHGFENRAHHFFGFVEPRRFALQQRADVFALNDADHSTILLSGYSTMPCPPACFKRGNDVAHRGFIENRIHRQPLFVAEVRNGGALQRRQNGEHLLPDRSCARSASAPLCPAR